MSLWEQVLSELIWKVARNLSKDTWSISPNTWPCLALCSLEMGLVTLHTSNQNWRSHFYKKLLAGTVVHSCDPSAWEVEAEGSGI